MGRDDFEDRQARRKERLEARARKALAESEAAYGRAREIGKQIPLGQPILVGHHSERGHRADLKRIDRAMEKCLEKDAEAKRLAARAASVGRAGVSSDDPDAPEKLAEKLKRLEAEQKVRKVINAAWRKAGRPAPDNKDGWDTVCRLSKLEAGALNQLRLEAARRWHYQPTPYPSYVQSNANAEMRRLRARLEQLEAEQQTEYSETDHGACQVIEDPAENRLKILFPGKPAPEVRKRLRAEGFKWSPDSEAWQRLLNNAARYAAGRVIAALTQKVEGE